MDLYNEKGCRDVINMVNKFGNEEMRQRFNQYRVRLDELKLAKAIEDIDELDPKLDTKPPAFHPDWNKPVDAAMFAAAFKQAQSKD